MIIKDIDGQSTYTLGGKSVLTVTNPPGFATLVFRRDNPCNTTIVDAQNATVYTVATDFANPDKPVTRVHDAAGVLVAEWVWRDARSDLLTMRGRPQIAVSSWLKRSLVPFKGTVTFQDDTGVEYKWANNSPGLALQLFGPESKTEPVVRFVRARKELKGPGQPSILLVDDRVERMRDMIVVSFLLLERRRRENETETASRASALAIPPFTV
ncbi:hypothetical protein BV25DRAFT_1876918 [Artomyces pyxidatus]|uniref:Uncharacterized protein n=1 Tax=Artomyces pyxidatus TaxID=48021 RepID=A0ACB8TFK5_9AGAM|nr:hypothetical protein BV25DRAFT_1876918 [Artomyces pyxidatus]